MLPDVSFIIILLENLCNMINYQHDEQHKVQFLMNNFVLPPFTNIVPTLDILQNLLNLPFQSRRVFLKTKQNMNL